MPEIHEHKGKHYSRTAIGGCTNCVFSTDGLGLCLAGKPPAFVAKEHKASPCIGDSGPSWEEATVTTKSKATKEPKKPTKPKPATVKPSAPKPEPSLYRAIRERLEAKDRETLHARTVKVVEAVEALLDGVQPVEVSGPLGTLSDALKHAPTPWSLDGLVVDPDPKEPVGKCGWFWDNGDEGVVRFGVGADAEGSSRKYESVENMSWDHFAYIPNFPGAELLKRTTGYEAA